MAWRVAKSLLVLREQINAQVPGRDKSADGTVGNPRHAASKSEHNPDANGVVRAMDITHDPAGGVDFYAIARSLIASKDPRILYVISNGKIASSSVSPWTWRKYTGENPHNHHVHLSVVPGPAYYDFDAPWRLDGVEFKLSNVIQLRRVRPLIHIGSKGDDVAYLQKKLGGLVVDADFGNMTDNAVRKFQKDHNLVVDGKVGKYTWEVIGCSFWRRFWCWVGSHKAAYFIEHDDGDYFECVDCHRRIDLF